MSEILSMLRDGKSSLEIARDLEISYATVNVHIWRLYKVCGAKDVDDLRALGYEEIDRRIAVNEIARKLKAWKGSPDLPRLMPYVLEALK